MRITGIGSYVQPKKQNQNDRQNPAFKSFGMGLLGASGAIMQGIENKGYLVSFLIQDGLGMTFPRVLTGFHRDKEITGEYNVQEGLEVLGREGMTGPFMIAVAPAVLWFTRKFCMSTNTNTRLIKRVGDNLKTMVSESGFNKQLKNDAKKFKEEFVKYNIEKIYKDSIPNDKKADETIKYLLTEFEKFDSKDKKASAEAYKNMLTTFNDKLVENSTELDDLCKLKVGEDKALFAAGDVIKAVRDYSHDAILNNKGVADLDAASAENIKNNFATKRLLTNWANIAATLGGLAVLPKIYARSNVAPGAKHLIQAQQEEQKQDNNVSFKGRGINSDGIFAKIGKFLTKRVPEWIQAEFEYTGYNFSPATFACLSLFGLLLPRGLRAYDRAVVDKNGKKDMSEVNEILVRDTISSLSVVFAVPILTKLIVNTYENKQGFILTNKASDNKNWFKKTLDLLNPFSDLKVLTNAELEALYGNIDSKKKMLNFCNYVDKKGGDLEKILSKSEFANAVFNESSFKLESLKGSAKGDKNKKIISLIEKMDEKSGKDLITKLMKGSGDIKKNKIATIARGLNSLPGVISTVIISPFILGVFIPMLTYANTRKAHAKMMQENNS